MWLDPIRFVPYIQSRSPVLVNFTLIQPTRSVTTRQSV